MLEHLHAASALLKSALEKYLDTCLTISSQYDMGNILIDAPETILEELQTIVSYESALDHSRRVVGKLRNRCGRIVPIHSLPPEILTRVFLFAHKTECAFGPDRPTRRSLKDQPGPSTAIIHTCSYWRSIAFSSRALWTHIDLGPFSSNEGWLLDRAQVFASHSGESQLAVHVNIGTRSDSEYKQSTLELCASVASKTKSIDLYSAHTLGVSHTSIVDKLLGNCTPGKLTQLTIGCGDDTSDQTYIVAKDTKNPPDNRLRVDASHRHLEEVLCHVTVLRLQGFYLYWTSQAYTGLVRLHLMGLTDDTITTSQLARVLSASPALQFFRFSYAIEDDGDEDEDDDDGPPQVYLGQLEALHLEFDRFDDHESVLRLIGPGPKPLRMSTVFGESGTPPLDEGEHGLFFERSNVVQLHAAAPTPNEPLEFTSLLQIMPQLQVLSLDGFDLEHREAPLIRGYSGLDPGCNLDELRLAASTLDLGAIHTIVGKYPFSEVLIDSDSCSVLDEDGDEDDINRYMHILRRMSPSPSFFNCGDPNEHDWEQHPVT